MSLYQARNSIDRFLEGGICSILMPVFCQRCKLISDDACENCVAHDLECDAELLILKLGREYMEKLAKDWKQNTLEIMRGEHAKSKQETSSGNDQPM